MENQELIVVKQLPEIEEHLKNVSLEIDQKVKEVESLICTEENKQAIKKLRAEMKKEFEEYEVQRKAVKEKVLAPYNKFEEVYKECISDKFKDADKEFKNKIDFIENEQKKKLEDEAKRYFEEYISSKNIDFIKFERLGLKVGLSNNPTKLKKQITAFIEKVVDDLNLIETQEHKAEILVEYKQTLNVSNAITTVANRFKAIEEEKKKQEELKNKIYQQMSGEANKAVEITQTNTEVEQQKAFDREMKDTQINQKTYTITFKVTGTAPRLKQLKDYLIKEGFQYE